MWAKPALNPVSKMQKYGWLRLRSRGCTALCLSALKALDELRDIGGDFFFAVLLVLFFFAQSSIEEIEL
jgi:hypothetical protein